MEILRHQFVLLFVFSILCIISHGGPYLRKLSKIIVSRDLSNILYRTLEGHNIAHVYTQSETEAYSILSRDQDGQQYVAVFVKKIAVHKLDLNRATALNFELYLLCTDGSYTGTYPGFYISLTDTNNRAPQFSELEYRAQVQLPWPGQLPIMTNVPIFVSDKDYTLSSTLAVSVDRPEILTVSAKQIQGSDFYHDFKVELFMSEFATPGEFEIELTFYDGVFRSTVPIHLNVTEMVCKLYSGNKPVFGGKFEENTAEDNEKIIYEGLLKREGQKVGETLLLEDNTVIEAYDPDGLCEIEFGANVDYLKIQKDGSIIFTRDLNPEEISQLDRKIVEIRASKSGSEEFNKIPLLLSLI